MTGRKDGRDDKEHEAFGRRDAPSFAGAKGKRQRPTRGTATVETYHLDPMYPKIVRDTASILAHGKVVAPVDVLVRMRVLDLQHLEDWRRGRVPYLERVIQGNLTRLSRLLRILRFHAYDLNLKPSWTAYMRWGKGPKQRLRFTKTTFRSSRRLCDALRVAGQGHVPSAGPEEGERDGRVTSRKVDIEKLRVALQRMKRNDLLMIAERAIEIVPRTKLQALVGNRVRLDDVARCAAGARREARTPREPARADSCPPLGRTCR